MTGYQHPRAYLLGLEGMALLRAFRGEHDRAFTEARVAEVRRLLDDERLDVAGVAVEPVDVRSGYRQWSATYDDEGNDLFELDRPFVRAVVDPLPPGRAVDAGCGTGRFAAYLAGRGHDVVGVDASPDMLAVARDRVPGAEFRPGDLERLPLPDGEADVVVCALALVHLPDLAAAIAELARVLRPGGHLVVSDVHPELTLRGSAKAVAAADGRTGRIASYRHPVGAYLRAALAAGLEVRRCEEPRRPGRPDAAPAGAAPAAAPVVDVGPWELWPWSLGALVPDAAAAASWDTPSLVLWHFRRPAAGGRVER